MTICTWETGPKDDPCKWELSVHLARGFGLMIAGNFRRGQATTWCAVVIGCVAIEIERRYAIPF